MRLAPSAIAAVAVAVTLATAPPADPRPRLPARIIVTSTKGTFQLGRDGRVTRVHPPRLPYPPGVVWYPATGSWYRLRHGRLVVGRYGATLWRSRRTYSGRFAIDVVNAGRSAVAFSYGLGPRQELYLARYGSAEQPVARGEFPLTWTSGGLFTYRQRGHEILLRALSGQLLATVSARPLTYAEDPARGAVYFIAHGALMAADGNRTTELAPLSRLGLPPRPSAFVEPVGPLLAIGGTHQVTLVRADGSLFAHVTLPRSQSLYDTIAYSSRGVAFGALSGPTSRTTETIYVATAGVRGGPGGGGRVGGTRILARAHLDLSGCVGGSSLAWRGRWLLFSATDGHLALIDTRPHRVIDLTSVVRPLAVRHASFGAVWAR